MNNELTAALLTIEKCRELTNCPAGVDLQDWVKQLAAENVALNNFIAKSCYVQAGENASWYPAIDHAPDIPTTNQLSIEESQFLTDVITAAGLLSCGKQDKGLARRITDFCVVKRGSSNPAQMREGADK
ncbi:hypothetical protein PGS10_11610 [Klebsiella sp. 141153]|uniref:hypothetical protein n=1 Tax=Klebsiella sp. 141153 TaxID=3020033 RepID=UPI002927A2DE|nr:hypothetical protein [Klebsiella sp. 141153]MDU9355288.1 hypothetical protein [Klebsiella sp. 141153]